MFPHRKTYFASLDQAKTDFELARAARQQHTRRQSISSLHAAHLQYVHLPSTRANYIHIYPPNNENEILSSVKKSFKQVARQSSLLGANIAEGFKSATESVPVVANELREEIMGSPSSQPNASPSENSQGQDTAPQAGNSFQNLKSKFAEAIAPPAMSFNLSG